MPTTLMLPGDPADWTMLIAVAGHRRALADSDVIAARTLETITARLVAAGATDAAITAHLAGPRSPRRWLEDLETKTRP